MAQPGYNPPNDNCPECEKPSKTYSLGGKTVDGVAQFRWECEHKHQWTVYEPRTPPTPEGS